MGGAGCDKLVRNVVRIPLIWRNEATRGGRMPGGAQGAVAIGISKTHVARVMCGKCRMQHLTANYNSELQRGRSGREGAEGQQGTRSAHKCG